MKKLNFLFLLALSIFNFCSCSDNDNEVEYPNVLEVNYGMRTYEIPSEGGDYIIAKPTDALYGWSLQDVTLITDGKSVPLYQDYDPKHENQELENAKGYKSKNYSIYEPRNYSFVICKIGRNQTGKERSFEIKFEGGDYRTWVTLHQSK